MVFMMIIRKIRAPVIVDCETYQIKVRSSLKRVKKDQIIYRIFETELFVAR